LWKGWALIPCRLYSTIAPTGIVAAKVDESVKETPLIVGTGPIRNVTNCDAAVFLRSTR